MNIKDYAKTIVCYGDSNTFGAIPRSDKRYPRSKRWTNILQKLLGENYEVVSEGLGGRTLVANDKLKPHRTGITHLKAILMSHDPIDLLIIYLGTNDIKSTYNLSAKDIALHLKKTIRFIKEEKENLEKIPKILILCPPSIIEPAKKPVSNEGKDLDKKLHRGIFIFKLLPKLFKKVSKNEKCDFINLGDYISSSPLDGCHLEPEAHQKIAKLLKEYVLKNKI